MYDIIIIGAGSAGLSAAKHARRYKLKFMLVEKKDDQVGGTCVNLGCIPKKLTYNFTSLLKQKVVAESYSVSYEANIDWQTFVKNRGSYVRNLASKWKLKFKELKLGQAKITGSNTVSIDNTSYKASHIIIASGSQPKYLNVKGREYLKSSDDFFYLVDVPKKVVIIGGGYIALEISSMLKNLGCDVHLLLHSDVILREFDIFIQNNVMNNIKSKVYYKVKVREVGKRYIIFDNDSNVCTIDNIDFIMNAVGRYFSPDFIDITIEKESEFLKVDQFYRTSVPSIYAIGDAIGKPMLTPVAINAGKQVIEYIVSKKTPELSKFIPTAVFCDPPCATVGYTESKARESFKTVNTHEKSFVSLYDFMTGERSHIKIVVANGIVVGLHMIGRHVEEIIQGFSLALEKNCTLEDFDNAICLHPSLAEEVLSWVVP